MARLKCRGGTQPASRVPAGTSGYRWVSGGTVTQASLCGANVGHMDDATPTLEVLLPAGLPAIRPDDAEMALAALFAEPRTPWLRANMIATLDGAATGADHRSGSINDPADLRVFRALRALADVVLVGAGTVRAEGYRAPRPPGVGPAPAGPARPPRARRAHGQRRHPRCDPDRRVATLGVHHRRRRSPGPSAAAPPAGAPARVGRHCRRRGRGVHPGGCRPAPDPDRGRSAPAGRAGGSRRRRRALPDLEPSAGRWSGDAGARRDGLAAPRAPGATGSPAARGRRPARTV